MAFFMLYTNQFKKKMFMAKRLGGKWTNLIHLESLIKIEKKNLFLDSCRFGLKVLKWDPFSVKRHLKGYNPFPKSPVYQQGIVEIF
jgi:hypothetical protein